MIWTHNRERLAAAWIGTILFAPLIFSEASWMPWLIATVVAAGPAIVLLHWEMPRTMSQSIQHAKR
jgi:hypothetical protein